VTGEETRQELDRAELGTVINHGSAVDLEEGGDIEVKGAKESGVMVEAGCSTGELGQGGMGWGTRRRRDLEEGSDPVIRWDRRVMGAQQATREETGRCTG